MSLKETRIRITGLLAAGAVSLSAAGLPALSMQVSAAPAYDTQWTSGYSFLTLLKSSLLNTNTDANGIYEQLKQCIKFKKVSEADIAELAAEGYRIPAESLRKLYTEGWISQSLYVQLTGDTDAAKAASVSCTPEQFKDVFDADYYVSANPVIAAAVQNGSLPSDEQTLFLNYISCGIPAGLSASSSFSFAYFESAYPTVAKDLSYDKLSEVLFYIKYKDSLGLKGNA